MKKARFAVVVAAATVALALVLSGCAGSGSNSPAKAEGPGGISKLTVGFDSSYPPYGFVGDDGSYTGFDLDLAKEVAKRNGWEFEASPIDWDAKDALLQSGSINCVWNGFTMEGREDSYTFSDP